MDIRILEELKNKISRYLESKGLNSDFFRNNMDNVATLSVENSVDRKGPKMQSRETEIMLDKEFVVFDKNNNPIGIDKYIEKLIKSQLGHELIHAATRYEGYTGIKKEDMYTGLNEGLTQMITEKIFNYTVSPKSDGYKDLKKIAKILDVTFGEEVVLNDYFNRTNNLEQKCNEISQNSDFYNSLNETLTSMFMIRPKKEFDMYWENIRKPQYNEMNELLIKKICANIIVPKLKSLPKEKQVDYVANILNNVKDDKEYARRLKATIKEVSNMDYEQLKKYKYDIDKKINNVTITREFVENLYVNKIDFDTQIIVDKKGNISFIGKENENIKVTNPFLKERILAQMFEREHKDQEFELKKVREGVLDFGDNMPPLERKKKLAYFKYIERKKGNIILNSLEELNDSSELKLNLVKKLNEKEPMSFDELKNFYEKYTIDYDSEDNVLVINKKNNAEIKDVDVLRIVKFASLWGTTKGTKGFSKESESVFNKLSQLVEESLSKKGSIDTEEIYNEISKMNYKNSGELIYNLFKNSENINIIDDFFRKQTSQAKMETELPKTTEEFINKSNEIDNQEKTKQDATNFNEYTDEIQQKKNKRIDEMLEVYDRLENEAVFKLRQKNEDKNISLIVNSLKEGKLPDEFLKRFNKKDGAPYTYAQVFDILRIVKAAKAISVEGGRNYFQEFCNFSYVDHMLNSVRKNDKTFENIKADSEKYPCGIGMLTQTEKDKVECEKKLSEYPSAEEGMKRNMPTSADIDVIATHFKNRRNRNMDTKITSFL